MSAPWKQKASSGGFDDSDIPAAENHPAVCVAIVDLGSTTETFKGDGDKGPRTSTVRKVYIAWELTASKMSGLKNANHVLGNRYTLSLNSKATLGKLIKDWRGAPLGENEEFDISVLLGKPCLLNVTHYKGEKRTYANVGSITKLPKGMECPKALLQPYIWAIGDGPFVPPGWLPLYCYGEKIADIIKDSPEWKALETGAQADDAFGGEEEETAEDPLEGSNIPF